MKVRNSLFVVLAAGLLLGGFSIPGPAGQSAVEAPKLVSDGGDPIPWPRPTRGTAIATEEAASRVLVADGGDPLPWLPHRLA